MSHSVKQRRSPQRHRFPLPLKPNQWGAKHLALIGARIDHPRDPFTVFPPIPVPQSLIEIVSSSSRASSPAPIAENVARKIKRYSQILDDPQRAGITYALELVESLLEELAPDYGQFRHLTLRLGKKKVAKFHPYSLVSDMVAFVAWLDKPTSEYAEETAYCLMLAQEEARRTRASAGVLRPVVIEVRDMKVVVVTAEVDVGYLEMLEKEASAMLKGKTVALRKNSLAVKVLRWDLRSQGDRQQFLKVLVGILQEERMRTERDNVGRQNSQ